MNENSSTSRCSHNTGNILNSKNRKGYSLAKIDEVSINLSGVAPGDGAEAPGDHQRQHEAFPVAFPPEDPAEALLPGPL